jgi:hypothetical protein
VGWLILYKNYNNQRKVLFYTKISNCVEVFEQMVRSLTTRYISFKPGFIASHDRLFILKISYVIRKIYKPFSDPFSWSSQHVYSKIAIWNVCIQRKIPFVSSARTFVSIGRLAPVHISMIFWLIYVIHRWKKRYNFFPILSNKSLRQIYANYRRILLGFEFTINF